MRRCTHSAWDAAPSWLATIVADVVVASVVAAVWTVCAKMLVGEALEGEREKAWVSE